MRLIPAALVLGALVALIACGNESEEIPTKTPAPSILATPAEISVSWGEAKQLLRDCKVTAVGQAHSLKVWLTLEDGTRAVTEEPQIDMVLDLAFDAQRKCGGQPEQIVTE